MEFASFLYTLYEKITACVTRGPCPENSWRSFDIIFIIYHSDMLIMMIKVIHSHLEPCWKSSLQLWKFFNFGLIFFRRSRQTEHACFGFFFLWDERKILIYYNLYIYFNTHLTTLKDIYKYLIFKWTPIFKNILVRKTIFLVPCLGNSQKNEKWKKLGRRNSKIEMKEQSLCLEMKQPCSLCSSYYLAHWIGHLSFLAQLSAQM